MNEQQSDSAKGPFPSATPAGGLGIVFLILFGGFLLVQLGCGAGSKVVIGTNDQVHFSDSATKEDAKALGDALKKVGYFSDKGVSVFLSRTKDGTVVSFAVKEGSWTRPEVASGFEEIGREIAPSVGGFPIKVRLVNTAQETKKELNVGRVSVGTKDEIYYYGSAAESDAKALGQSLKSAEFFQNRGVTVFLAKNDDGTAISFIVDEGTWDNPTMVAGFETLVRQSAPSVGGLPIKLRFLNPKLETKKEVKVG